MRASSPPVSTARRHLATWGVLGGCLVIGGLLLPLPVQGPFFDGLTDAMHSPGFAAVTWAALVAVRSCGWRSLSLELALAAGLIVCSAVLEGLQAYSGRSPSWHDLIANVEGVCAGVLLQWGIGGLPGPLRSLSAARLARVAAVLLAAILLFQGMRAGVTLSVEHWGGA